MLIRRILPPTAARISLVDIFNGFKGLLRGQAEIERFKSEIKKYYRVRHCFLISSGKAALTVILRALQQISPQRKEVLIPAYTCYSVPAAIVRAGLKVRLADIDPNTLDYDFADLKKSLQNKEDLLAVISPHLFGHPADIQKTRNILDDPQVTVIEDAAQAMGGTGGGGHLLGTFGDVGFFSLGRGKAFSTVEGGIIITNSDELAKEVDFFVDELPLQSVGSSLRLVAYALALAVLIHPSFFWLPKSIPGLKLGETIYNPQFSIKRFSAFQAGLAGKWQAGIAAMQAQRKKNLAYWADALSGFSWMTPIYNEGDSAKEALPLLRFPVLIHDASFRETLLDISDKHGLGIMPMYPDAIDKIHNHQFADQGRSFPGAAECSQSLVTFPVHGFVTPKDQRKIVKCLEAIQ